LPRHEDGVTRWFFQNLLISRDFIFITLESKLCIIVAAKMNTRKIKQIFNPVVTMEGAGLKLKRIFGYQQVPLFDPFLLLDYFGSDNPGDYMAGFPWHPHRGIETVTYMIEGSVEHGDSLGNSGVISSGEIQWMTAGSGIIHQEMPKEYKGRSRGMQLWINLPQAGKLTDPRYRDISADMVPITTHGNGISVKIIAGEFNGIKGAAPDLFGGPEYLDVTMLRGKKLEIERKAGLTVFAFVFEGNGFFDNDKKTLVENEQCVLFGDGDCVDIEASDAALRFLLVSGKPLNEPVAWRGPIVMNTQKELVTAFRELDEGTFIKR